MNIIDVDYDSLDNPQVKENSSNPTLIYNDLRKILLFKNDEWINLAFHLLIGKLIMQYRFLEEEKRKKKGQQQDIIFAYRVGKLLWEFAKRREKDIKKSELSENPKLNLKRNTVINLLVDLLDAIETSKKVRYGARYFRYCCQFYDGYNLSEIDTTIPFSFYIELHAKINSITKKEFKNIQQARSYRKKIIHLRKKYNFSNFHLRIIWNLVLEDTKNRLTPQYFEDIYKIIKNMPKKLKMNESLKEAKKLIDINQKKIKKIHDFF